MPAHPHARIMLEYAQKAAKMEKPFVYLDYRQKGTEKWLRCTRQPTWSMNCEFRWRPKTRTINGYEVPYPETEAPTIGSDYFVPILGYSDKYYISEWNNDERDLVRLESGLVHLSMTNATIHSEALSSFFKKD